MKICPDCYNRPYADKEMACENCGGALQPVPQKSKKKTKVGKQEAPVIPGSQVTAEGAPQESVAVDVAQEGGKKGKKAKKEKPAKAPKGGKEEAPVVPKRSGMFQKTTVPGANATVAEGTPTPVAGNPPVGAVAEGTPTPVAGNPPVGAVAEGTPSPVAGNPPVEGAEGSIFRRRTPPPPPEPPKKKSLFSKKK